MKNRRKNKAKKKLLTSKEKEEADPSKWENINLNSHTVNLSKKTISLIQWGNFKLIMFYQFKIRINHIINQITFIFNLIKLTQVYQAKVNQIKLEKEIIAQ